MGQVDGGQLGLVANLANDVRGFQASIVNNATEGLLGFQVGVLNITPNRQDTTCFSDLFEGYMVLLNVCWKN